MKNRRDFIRKSSFASIALVGLNDYSLADIPTDEKLNIVIAHTNDMHSHIDPFPSDDPKYANMGGMAQRATMIDALREDHGEILLLDSGDIFQGTPYFNFFGGHLELELMSMMGYDASTLGNHDFDGGMEGFLSAQENANFPFLCSNYNMKDTPLDGATRKYKVFKRNGLRIGVFGLGIELKGLVDPSLYKGVVYEDPVIKAKQMTSLLRKGKRCDLVICLSHLGLEYKNDKISDKRLAPQVPGLDLILGGHTHSFMKDLHSVDHDRKNRTHVHQVGWAGVRLGIVEFTMAMEKDVAESSLIKQSSKAVE